MKLRRGRTSRRIGVLAATMSLLLGFTTLITAPAASAYEFECDGYFNNFPDNAALPCVEPEPFYWYDHAYPHDNSATVLHLVNCSANPDIALQRSPNGRTDWANYGPNAVQRFWCLNTDGGWKGWGDVPEGYYRFVIANPRSSDNRLDVGYFHAAW